MGMFTWVKPADEIMPEQHRGIDGWQTKDVVDCQLETLEIAAEGQLVHVWWEREFEENKESILGFYMRKTVEHCDVLSYHGDMNFYTHVNDVNDDDMGWVEYVARFDDGKLRSVTPVTEVA